MGVQDRDWYRDELQRKEKLYYNPRPFRRAQSADGPGGYAGPAPKRLRNVVLACLATVCAVLIILQWRGYDSARRQLAATAEREQKEKLQVIERQRATTAEAETRLSRYRKEEASRMQGAAARRGAEERARDAAAENERRREALWKQFYTPAPGCERNTTVECANAFIRARRQFNVLLSKQLDRAGPR